MSTSKKPMLEALTRRRGEASTADYGSTEGLNKSLFLARRGGLALTAKDNGGAASWNDGTLLTAARRHLDTKGALRALKATPPLEAAPYQI